MGCLFGRGIEGGDQGPGILGSDPGRGDAGNRGGRMAGRAGSPDAGLGSVACGRSEPDQTLTGFESIDPVAGGKTVE